MPACSALVAVGLALVTTATMGALPTFTLVVTPVVGISYGRVGLGFKNLIVN